MNNTRTPKFLPVARPGRRISPSASARKNPLHGVLSLYWDRGTGVEPGTTRGSAPLSEGRPGVYAQQAERGTLSECPTHRSPHGPHGGPCGC